MARNQIHKNIKMTLKIKEGGVRRVIWVSKRVMIRLKKMIIPYSAIKISANLPAPYSVLNPETNSDSPSAKSKGVRFVSATADTNNRIIRGDSNKILINFFSVAIPTENLLLKINTEKRSRASLIS